MLKGATLFFSWLGMVSSIAAHLLAYINAFFLNMDSREFLFLILPLIVGLIVTYIPAVYRDMNLTDAWHNKKYRWGKRRWGSLKEIAQITITDSPEWMKSTAYQMLYILLGYFLLLSFGAILGGVLVNVSVLPQFALLAVTGLLIGFYYFAVAIHTSALKGQS
jgi:hypothetical protein